MKQSLLLLMSLLLVGCAAEKTDYSHCLQRMAHSIVVIAALNESTQVRAPEEFLSTVTMPLAERGYYVFPVAMVHAYMVQNGLPTSGEMHQASPQRFRDILGADAVLYITIKQWTNQYIVINSTTSVTLDYRLVDTATGEELWHHAQTVKNSSGGSGGGSIEGQLIAAAVSAAVHAATDVDAHRERALAAQANQLVIADSSHGMLPGPRHPKYEEEQKKHRNELGVAEPAPSAPAAPTQAPR